MQNMKFPIGLDIGHSTVKLVANRGIKIIFPSQAALAIPISDEKEAKRAALETVRVKGRDYFFGETSVIQYGTTVATGLTDNWIATNEHTALFLGALKKLEQQGIDPAGEHYLAMGLPTRLHATQKDELREMAASYMPNSTIKILPQPWGPFQKLMTDVNGMPSQTHSIVTESWAVIDVGYFTTDILLIHRGHWVEKAIDSCAGVRVAAEHLSRVLASQHDIKADLPECDQALRDGYIMHFGKKIDLKEQIAAALETVATEVVDEANRLLASHIRKINGVIVAGGGASLVYDQLKLRWPHTELDNDPRFSVAEGFRRFAVISQLVDQ